MPAADLKRIEGAHKIHANSDHSYIHQVRKDLKKAAHKIAVGRSRPKNTLNPDGLLKGLPPAAKGKQYIIVVEKPKLQKLKRKKEMQQFLAYMKTCKSKECMQYNNKLSNSLSVNAILQYKIGKHLIGRLKAAVGKTTTGTLDAAKLNYKNLKTKFLNAEKNYAAKQKVKAIAHKQKMATLTKEAKSKIKSLQTVATKQLKAAAKLKGKKGKNSKNGGKSNPKSSAKSTQQKEAKHLHKLKQKKKLKAQEHQLKTQLKQASKAEALKKAALSKKNKATKKKAVIARQQKVAAHLKTQQADKIREQKQAKIALKKNIQKVAKTQKKKN